MLKFLTAGESHGPAEVAILEGLPAGLTISKEDIQADLDKRKGGYGRGGRGKIESDEVEILSGIRLGKTLGSPIALFVKNNDFANWQERMQAGAPESHLQEDLLQKRETKPRPGHADLAGALKYQTDDVRNILERASARETIMRVAVGAICRKFLLEFGIEVASHTIGIGSVHLTLSDLGNLGKLSFFEKIKKVYETDPDIRCIDELTSEKMKVHIRQTTIKKDTLGGVIEIIAHNVPVGLGSHVHWDRKLDGRIAQALMSIPSVKGVEIGEAIKASSSYGSEVQDEIFYRYPGSDLKRAKGLTLDGTYYRKTNRLGGIEGGISNGEDIICRVYHKPISTLASPLKTVDITTKQPTQALIERSDVCVIPRAGIISESMLAYILADALLEKFGGDHIDEAKRNYQSYKEWILAH